MLIMTVYSDSDEFSESKMKAVTSEKEAERRVRVTQSTQSMERLRKLHFKKNKPFIEYCSLNESPLEQAELMTSWYQSFNVGSVLFLYLLTLSALPVTQ